MENYKIKKKVRKPISGERSGESPPPSPRVVLPRPAGPSNSSTTSTPVIATRPISPVRPTISVAAKAAISANLPEAVQARIQTSSSPSPVQLFQTSQNESRQTLSEERRDATASMPTSMKLIEGETWSLMEHPTVEFVLGESASSGINVVAAIGMQSVGKSTLLNYLAGKKVFKTHKDVEKDNLLQHVTVGADVHITPERTFLIDTQALLSASLLDEFLRSGQPTTIIASEIAEPETYIYIISLQLVSFLLSMCDHVIVVSDWAVDLHLIKLIASAIMMVGSNSVEASIIWFVEKPLGNYEAESLSTTLESLLGRGVVKLFNGSHQDLIQYAMKAPSKSKLVDSLGRNNHHSSEKSWLVSAQRHWENSVKKTTLYSDYARFVP